MKTLLLAIGIIIPVLVFAHGKEEHPEKQTEKKEHQEERKESHQDVDQTGQMKQVMKSQIESINKNYQANVKGIFKEKCIDCHGTPEQYPWYYQVPGIKQIMDYDIREAKEHLEISNDFPFEGHGTPLSDLKTVKETVEKNSMPPFSYRIVHPNSRLSAKDKEIILRWIDQSMNRLRQ